VALELGAAEALKQHPEEVSRGVSSPVPETQQAALPLSPSSPATPETPSPPRAVGGGASPGGPVELEREGSLSVSDPGVGAGKHVSFNGEGGGGGGGTGATATATASPGKGVGSGAGTAGSGGAASKPERPGRAARPTNHKDREGDRPKANHRGTLTKTKSEGRMSMGGGGAASSSSAPKTPEDDSAAVPSPPPVGHNRISVIRSPSVKGGLGLAPKGVLRKSLGESS
jgi:hypothetical protein